MHEMIAKPFIPMNLQLFAGESGGEGGTGGEGGDGGTAGGGNGEKTFTQAELDTAVQARVSRAEKTAKTALAKELGFDSVEAMQAALKKQEPTKKTDKKDEKPIDVEALVEEKLKAKQKEQDDRTFKRLLTAEVKVLANELGFADWEDALALADMSKVTEDDKGNLIGVKEAMDDLLKKKPHLGKQKPGAGSFGATVPNSQEQRKKSQEALINLAKSRGVAGGQSAHDPWANK
ncbi:scaffolding protein [Paenibacillus yanchengensis]|uniref:Scaffolding protein n=1 Tax=Paenibacillus yanchengensis TaxID=2035833 RepID=A0ABW4YKW2_9BACL